MIVMMKCGHASNAETADRKPCCAICMGLTKDAEIVTEDPNLIGRVSSCTYCGVERRSGKDLAFFAYRPDMEKDSHYCGCRGWD